MHRFIVEDFRPESGAAYITGDELEHLRRVLRLHPGDTLEILTPMGAYGGCIASVDAERAEVAGLIPLPSREAVCRITLYQCLPKADRMETVLTKGVELGVAAFVPVLSERCVARIGRRDDAARKLERWHRIVREAAKQSGRTALPRVRAPMPWDEAIAVPASLKLLPWEATAEDPALGAGLRSVLVCVPRDVSIYIGPEGGLTSEEAALGARGGARIVSLGPRILRTDTAGIAAAAAVLFASGDMGG